jgi:uncharacterized phage-associated protein
MAVAFQFDSSATVAAITFLASRGVPELTKYKLCKLLFLADKYHLVKYGRIITGDKYCALPHGPVPSRTLNILNAVINNELRDSTAEHLANLVKLDRGFEQPRFHADELAVETDELSQSDILALEQTIDTYGRMGFGELKAITHEMFAYKQAWGDRSQGSNAEDMSFEAFFEEDSDAVVGARDAMIEDHFLRASRPVF